MKILHVITSLGDGGAENTLYKICKYDRNNTHIVISLRNKGKYFSLLKKLNVKVYCLNINFFSIYKFFSLIKIIRLTKPNIVQTWLVHADFIGTIAARISGIKNIFWNIRYSKIGIRNSKFTTILIIKLLSKLSFLFPKKIIVVSKKSKKIYEIEGYDKNKFVHIPNGYDLSTLENNRFKSINLEKKIKIHKKVPRLGYIARYDPLKDHLNLIHALSIIRMKGIIFFCILVGTNINNNKFLNNEIEKFNLKNYVRLFGPTKNISSIMNWLDIHVQSSISEGFPNVIAEAMALRTPCVVTNVGDSLNIVGETGWVVPPNDSEKLAKAIEGAIKEIKTKNWKKRCNRARERIKKNFTIGKMIKSYNKEWVKVYKNSQK